MHLSCHLQMAKELRAESVSYPERRRRRQRGRGRRLVAAWLGPAPILTGHHPPAEPCVHNFHPHVNRPHSRPPPPHPAAHKVPAPLLHPSLIFSNSESEPKMNVDCISQNHFQNQMYSDGNYFKSVLAKVLLGGPSIGRALLEELSEKSTHLRVCGR